MNDTVKRITELADEYAHWNRWTDSIEAKQARQALEDELTRLFTPLTDEQIKRVYHKFGGDMINCARSIERQHGITGEGK